MGNIENRTEEVRRVSKQAMSALRVTILKRLSRAWLVEGGITMH
ncbi:hypothetical protein L810_6725 [Burkholderia sp. AU4i]|nr:hypothetical protein L810_6725 [Burkholderia sp. AU4i]QOH37162.1 hypothetical protein C7S14_0824 [Burkholderia cepacia]